MLLSGASFSRPKMKNHTVVEIKDEIDFLEKKDFTSYIVGVIEW